MKTNNIIMDYDQRTRGESPETMCADCACAVWSILDNRARGEDEPAYSATTSIALTAYCTARSKSMRGPVYACSAWAANTDTQAEDIGKF